MHTCVYLTHRITRVQWREFLGTRFTSCSIVATVMYMFQQQFVRVWCGCGGSFPLSHYPGGDRVAGYTRSLIGDGVGMGENTNISLDRSRSFGQQQKRQQNEKGFDKWDNQGRRCNKVIRKCENPKYTQMTHNS